MQKVAKVFRLVVLLSALLGLIICMFKSYTANHYFDVVLMGAISVILLNTDRLTWALDDYAPNCVSYIGLPKRVFERLIKIKTMIGADTVTDVCREAFKVYDILVSTTIEDKARIFIETPDGERAEFVILSPKSTDDKPASFEITGATFQNVTDDDIRKAVKEQFEDTADKLRESIPPQIR